MYYVISDGFPAVFAIVHCHALLNPGVAVELTSSYNYAGVTLSEDLTWNAHVTNILSSPNRSLGFFKPNVKLLAYTSLVRTKVEYASPIWSPNQICLITSLE